MSEVQYYNVMQKYCIQEESLLTDTSHAQYIVGLTRTQKVVLYCTVVYVLGSVTDTVAGWATPER